MDLKSISKSKKNECRSTFRKCFKNFLFSLVPYEIWRDLIVSNADLHSITILSQTCHAFEELVDDIGENNFNLALLFRKEGQIDLAKKYLFKCAENSKPLAMFHLGYAYDAIGWGLEEVENAAVEWFKKSAELGNFSAMALYSNSLRYGFGVEKSEELSNVWAQKALSTNSFGAGFCHLCGLGVRVDNNKAFVCFETSAKEGDELGQYWLARSYYFGYGTEVDYEKALFWYLKSAEQGQANSLFYVSEMYLRGKGCEKDEEKAIIWLKKSARQRKRM